MIDEIVIAGFLSIYSNDAEFRGASVAILSA
jgi:hypothetical protein